MVKCDKCGTEVFMPYRCNYCGGYFCDEHRLPEFHDCRGAYNAPRVGVAQSGTYTPSGGFYTDYTSSRIIRSYWFSRQELRDLAIGLAVIIVIPLVRIWGLLADEPVIALGFVSILALAFLLHEFAHKFMAQRLGLWAEFRLSMTGLLFTLLSFTLLQVNAFPLMIVAPGAVMIAGRLQWGEYGKVSIVGPLTNIAQALIYGVIFVVTWSDIVAFLAIYGVAINSGLALFNLIPFGVFDGEKILKWSWKAWLALVVVAGGLFLLTQIYM